MLRDKCDTEVLRDLRPGSWGNSANTSWVSPSKTSTPNSTRLYLWPLKSTEFSLSLLLPKDVAFCRSLLLCAVGRFCMLWINHYLEFSDKMTGLCSDFLGRVFFLGVCKYRQYKERGLGALLYETGSPLWSSWLSKASWPVSFQVLPHLSLLLLPMLDSSCAGHCSFHEC